MCININNVYYFKFFLVIPFILLVVAYLFTYLLRQYI